MASDAPILPARMTPNQPKAVCRSTTNQELIDSSSLILLFESYVTNRYLVCNNLLHSKALFKSIHAGNYLISLSLVNLRPHGIIHAKALHSIVCWTNR
jgi:hypothetical protein